eukprot:TRINITY_DN12031_c0_g1_i1.p1 TRINITY_DN12031_c0_g1~~TRINITY_DN12031_c0_g1_i1.p1  ORF type:complete len:1461 (-),score=372.02 TRINITY_DN12031_c0_g1_i1:12-4394(-)
MDDLLKEFGSTRFPTTIMVPTDGLVADVLHIPTLPPATPLTRLLTDQEGVIWGDRALQRCEIAFVDAVADMLQKAPPLPANLPGRTLPVASSPLLVELHNRHPKCLELKEAVPQPTATLPAPSPRRKRAAVQPSPGAVASPRRRKLLSAPTISTIQDAAAQLQSIIELAEKLSDESEEGSQVQSHQIQSLRSALSTLQDTSQLHSLGEDLLKRIVVMFGKIASNIDEENLSDSLDAAHAALTVMTCANISKAVLVEEAIEQIVASLRSILSKHVFPAADAGSPPQALAAGASAVMSLLQALVLGVPLNDSLVVELSTAALSTFFVENLTSLQLSAMSVLCALYQRYPPHRLVILQDVIHDIQKLPSNKRTMRAFRLADSSASIQMVSALLLQLFQCSTSFQETDTFAAAVGRTGCAATFITNLLQRCSSRGDGKTADADVRAVVENILEDWLTVLFLPEWPAAEFTVFLLTGALFHILQEGTSQALRTVALDLLGVTAARIRQEVMAVEATPSDQEPMELRKAVIAVMNAKTRDNVVNAAARRFYLIQWMNDEAGTAIEEFAKEAWELPVEDSEVAAAESESGEDVRAMLRRLASRRSLLKSFDNILTYILRALTDAVIPMRVRALRALTAVIQEDPSVLLKPQVEQAVRQRFIDTTISVREAAVDLVGQHLQTRPDLINQYAEIVMERIKDTGISVRKRVVKILKSVCLEHNDHPLVPQMCAALLSRTTGDDEAVSEIVLKTVAEMWFSTLPSSNKAAVLRQRTNQMMIVVNLLRTPSSVLRNGDWLVTLIEPHLMGTVDTEDGKTSKVIAQICSQMVDEMMEQLLQVEEAVTVGGLNSDQRAERLLALVNTLDLFCRASPSLMNRHAKTLLVYLKESEKPELLCAVMGIIERVIKGLRDAPIEFLSDLETSLVPICYKANPTAVIGAMSCLCRVIDVSRNYRLLLQLVRQYFAVLCGDLNLQRNNVYRAIYICSLACQFMDMDSKAVADADDDSDSVLTPGNIVLSVYKALLRAYEEASFRNFVISGLARVFLRRPKLLVGREASSVISRSLRASADVQEKCSMLKALQDFLDQEEANIKATQKLVATKSTAEEATLNADSGLSSGVIQTHSAAIRSMCVDSNATVRRQAVGLVSVILRQGLLLPAECTAALFGASADPDRYTCETAAALLCGILEKSPQFIIGHIVDGMRQIARLVEGPLAGVYNLEATARVYPKIRDSGKQNRVNVLTALLGVFPDPVGADKVELSMYKIIVRYLSVLPFASLDEPLSVLQKLTHFVSAHAPTILSSLKAGVQERKETERKKLASHANFALLLVLLMKLKRHLKSLYMITDKRITEFGSSAAAVTAAGKEKLLPASARLEMVDVALTVVEKDETDSWRAIEAAFQLLKDIEKQDTVDGASSYSTPARAKRASSGTPRKTASTASAKKPKSKKKARKSRHASDSEDEAEMTSDEYEE